MSSLPLPVRLAAGLVVTALEQAKTLPQQLVGLPMTMASRALQVSMRAQQHITDLAIKGDAVFAQLRPVEEVPQWAHFDEDDGFDPFDEQARARADGTADIDIGAGDDELAAMFAPADPPPSTPSTETEIRESDVAKDAVPEVPPDAPSRMPAAEADEAASNGALPLDHYSEMSLAQLRGKLRSLSLPQLESLLAYENDHAQRPAFVTMLSNRITTVRSK